MTKDDQESNEVALFADLNIKKVLTGSIEEFTDSQAATAWATVDLMEKVVKERKDQLRESLMNRAKAGGVKRENGTCDMLTDGTTVTCERRVATLPDEDVVKACLKEAKLQHEDAFTAQMVWTMDPSKVDFLVNGGMLPAEKIEASKKETFVLKVKVAPALKTKLDSVKLRLNSGQ